MFATLHSNESDRRAREAAARPHALHGECTANAVARSASSHRLAPSTPGLLRDFIHCAAHLPAMFHTYLLGVLAPSQRALAAHLCQQQQAAALGQPNLRRRRVVRGGVPECRGQVGDRLQWARQPPQRKQQQQAEAKKRWPDALKLSPPA